MRERESDREYKQRIYENEKNNRERENKQKESENKWNDNKDMEKGIKNRNIWSQCRCEGVERRDKISSRKIGVLIHRDER